LCMRGSHTRAFRTLLYVSVFVHWHRTHTYIIYIYTHKRYRIQWYTACLSTSVFILSADFQYALYCVSLYGWCYTRTQGRSLFGSLFCLYFIHAHTHTCLRTIPTYIHTYIHTDGNLPPDARLMQLENFRQGNEFILVCTDIMARGTYNAKCVQVLFQKSGRLYICMHTQ
jgi:hypothetical protein